MCVSDTIHDLELYSVERDLDPELVRQSTATAKGLLAWMRTLDLSPRGPIATDESTEAGDIVEHARTHTHTRTHTHAKTARMKTFLVLS